MKAKAEKGEPIAPVSLPAKVTITIDPLNDAPAAGNDEFATAEDTPLSGNVLVNDTDADGDSLSTTLDAAFSIKDLTFRESLTLFPLVALTILFGVYPKPVLDMSAASVQQLVNNYNAAVTAVKAAALIQ